MEKGERFKERIREAIKLAKGNGHTQQNIGELAGVSPQAVGQWPKSGKISNENLSVLARLAGRPIEWFYSGSIGEPRGPYAVSAIEVSAAPTLKGLCPEISWVQAGQWAEVCDINTDPETTNWYPRPPGASDQTFVLRVVGESMMPDYPPGRLIFVDPDQVALPNDDVVAVMTESNEATFKRLIEEPGSPRMLKALNPAWHNPYLEINGNCQIIGVVIADMRMRQR
ncbi:LexA family protein [Halomonas sp. AOP43-D1-4]|uniref:LexA family protein n=1 Tax=Halomonas sp. AOP43-D1-4 TaxID=3457658 RepID=UPI004033F7C4